MCCNLWSRELVLMRDVWLRYFVPAATRKLLTSKLHISSVSVIVIFVAFYISTELPLVILPCYRCILTLLMFTILFCTCSWVSWALELDLSRIKLCAVTRQKYNTECIMYALKLAGSQLSLPHMILPMLWWSVMFFCDWQSFHEIWRKILEVKRRATSVDF